MPVNLSSSTTDPSAPEQGRRPPVRVLVVDDSAFFRRRLTEALAADPAIQVVGSARDGREAVARVTELRPDVVTMDVEMPVMDGITAVRQIMTTVPTAVLMISAATQEGARATVEALEAGALDFIPKPGDLGDPRFADAVRRLRERVRLLGWSSRARLLPAASPRPLPAQMPASVAARGPASEALAQRFRLVVLGTSTGGPVALQRVLTTLPGDFPVPLMLVQHMPAGFTRAFAARLDQLCAIRVQEAEDGSLLRPGQALLAPGGLQALVQRGRSGAVVRIRESTPDQHYRPSVDLAFATAAETFPGQVLAVVLTGMGADGREGARLLKSTGSTVWAQDEASCVVYGMPAAVEQAGLADRVLPLEEIGARLLHGQ
jgi:two-component system chemotaxis response regulator CheB